MGFFVHLYKLLPSERAPGTRAAGGGGKSLLGNVAAEVQAGSNASFFMSNRPKKDFIVFICTVFKEKDYQWGVTPASR